MKRSILRQFLDSLLLGEKNTSSKRFAGLLSLITAIVIALIATVKNGGNVPRFIYDGLLFYSASAFGLTTFEKIFSKKDTEVIDDKKQ